MNIRECVFNYSAFCSDWFQICIWQSCRELHVNDSNNNNSIPCNYQSEKTKTIKKEESSTINQFGRWLNRHRATSRCLVGAKMAAPWADNGYQNRTKAKTYRSKIRDGGSGVRTHFNWIYLAKDTCTTNGLGYSDSTCILQSTW